MSLSKAGANMSQVVFPYIDEAHGSYWGPLALLFVSLVCLWAAGVLSTTPGSSSGAFRTADGRRLPHHPEDTRFERFSRGAELADTCRGKYGPLYTTQNGTSTELILTTPTQVMAFYKGDAKAHEKQGNINFGHYFGRLLGKCVGAIAGERWQLLRGIFDPFFTNSVAIAMGPEIIRQVDQWLSALQPAASTPAGFQLEAVDATARLPFRIIAVACFGDVVLQGDNFERLWSLTSLHERVFKHAALHRWAKYPLYEYLFWSPANRDMSRFQHDFTAFCLDMVRQGRTCKEESPASIQYRRVEDQTMSMGEWTQTIDEILFANIDVTAAVVAWQLLWIAQDKVTQLQLRQEIRDGLRGHSSGSDAYQDFICRTDTFLHRCFLEGTRISPPTFFSLPEVARDAKVIEGHRVPPGTPYCIAAWTLNRASPVWGSDGHQWRPDRFVSLKPADYRYSLWRFGMGVRRCVGQNIADKIIKTSICFVLDSYDISIAGELPVPRPDSFTNTPQGQLHLRPLPVQDRVTGLLQS